MMLHLSLRRGILCFVAIALAGCGGAGGTNSTASQTAFAGSGYSEKRWRHLETEGTDTLNSRATC